MPSSKDIKEILEARKARRAIPQVDPPDVVGHPVPEVLPPAQRAQRIDDPTPDGEVSQPVMEEPPELEAAEPSPAAPLVPPPSGLEVDDPRTQPAPPDDLYVPKTLRVKSHRERQLKAEAYHRDLLMQDIVETALDEYFKKRYGRQGRK
jgi:hypothetical protein